MFENLGFIPHEGKSVTIPSQQLVLLGHLFYSLSISVSLNENKLKNLS